MAYWPLADFVAVLHGAFVLFAVFGSLAAVRWPRLAWLHLSAVAWACLVELAGWTCPLTPLEIRWRELAGGAGYDGSFVQLYLIPALYPERLTREAQLVLRIGVGARVRSLSRWRASVSRRATKSPGGARAA